MKKIAIVAGNEIGGTFHMWHEHPCKRVIITMFGVAATLVIYEACCRPREIIRKCI